MEDIQEMKPTVFCGVPRVYDRVYSGTLSIYSLFLLPSGLQYLRSYKLLLPQMKGIQQKIASGGLLARKLFEYAYD